MDKFPDWAEGLFAADPGQHPHTLNLVLKLADPCKLPLMLLDVATSQPTIQRALNDLSFLHFARFLPSWDGSSLIVVTEFDGPLKPYVMDFVIVLGDVFNKLLSYVEEPPPLPVQQYPDAFWSYVEKWNRVPYAPRSGNSTGNVFPPDYDYPVYSAYPTKTVVDIAGPRDPATDGLRPALDRRAADVNLADVQGNILHGYHARRATHLMLRVTDAAKARRWLAKQHVQDGKDWGPTKPSHALLNVAFTYEGLLALLPKRSDDLARFPEAFREGPAKRAADNGDNGDSAPALWRFGGPVTQSVHVVLSLYGLRSMTPTAFRAAVTDTAKEANESGLTPVHAENAYALKNDRIYFGFRDGISDPRFAGQPLLDGRRQTIPDRLRLSMQPASSPGEFLLGQGYDSIYGGESLPRHMPLDISRNGCFGAMRLIEQHVARFDQVTAGLAAQFGGSPSDAAARLLGRWPDGQPLSQHRNDPGPLPPKVRPRNDFDYAPNWEYPGEPLDHEGRRCPLDAHIRRTNPRSHRVAGARHTRRLLRRGMPAKWSEGADRHRGLMGLFLCADLERQFEFIQRQWVQGGEGGRSDPIAGVRGEATSFRWSPTQCAHIPPLVRTRGSLYLFFPSISMLRRLRCLDRPGPELPPVTTWPEPRGLERLLSVQVPAVLDPLPRISELLIEWLVRRVLPSEAVAEFVKGLLPQPLPDLGELPKELACPLPALSTEFIADPCVCYRRLRTHRINFFWEPSHFAFLALRRADVQRILTDVDNFVQSPSTSRQRGIITLDGTRHDIVRQAFWESLAEPIGRVTGHVDAAFDERWQVLGGLRQFDAVRDLGVPVLNQVYWQLFGLPKTERDACSAYAATAMRQFCQPGARRSPSQLAGANASVRLWMKLAAQLLQAMLWDRTPLARGPYAGTLLGGIAARTRLPIPGLAALSSSGRSLDFMTAVTSLLQFVLAGHLAPQLLFSSATHNFLAHHVKRGTTVWAHLAKLESTDREAPLATALDESRRFDPPVTIIQRYTARAVTIRGVVLPPDTPVFAVAASANRDGPRRQRLNQFIWDREHAPQHFSLGRGPHHCIGAALQQIIMPRLLGHLMTAAPHMRLVDPNAVPAWIDNIYFRGLESLPVAI